jgi:hypothetical protein
VIVECGDGVVSTCVVVVRQHSCNEIHFLAALVAGIADTVKHHRAGLGDFLNLFGIEQLRQVEAERRLPVRRRQGLEREMLWHEFLLLDGQGRTSTMRLETGLYLLLRDIAVRRITVPGMHMARLLVPVARATILVEAMPAHCFS